MEENKRGAGVGEGSGKGGTAPVVDLGDTAGETAGPAARAVFFECGAPFALRSGRPRAESRRTRRPQRGGSVLFMALYGASLPSAATRQMAHDGRGSGPIHVILIRP